MTARSLNLPVGREGRILAVGILVLLVALTYWVVVEPLVGWYAARGEEIERQRALIGRLERAIAEQPQLEARLAAMRASGATVDALLKGDSDAVAGAELLATLKGMVAQSGGTLTSAENLPAEARGPFRQVGVRAAVTADLAALATLLQTIEEARPPLLIDNLQIRGESGQATATAKLTIGFDAYGLRAWGG